MGVESILGSGDASVKLRCAPGPGFLESWRWIRRWRKDLYKPVGELMDEYGDIARLDVGIECLHILNNPEWAQECLVTRHRDFHKDKYYFFLKLLLGEGLLTSEEDFHLRQRRMIQPAFCKERIHAYGMAMAQYATEPKNPGRMAKQ